MMRTEKPAPQVKSMVPAGGAMWIALCVAAAFIRSLNVRMRGASTWTPESPLAGSEERSAGGAASIPNAPVIAAAARPELSAISSTRVAVAVVAGTVHGRVVSPTATGPAYRAVSVPSIVAFNQAHTCASASSVTRNRTTCVEPPVQSSPPRGARIAAVGGQTVEKDHEWAKGIGMPGLELSRAASTVAVYVVQGANGEWAIVSVWRSGDQVRIRLVTGGRIPTPVGGKATMSIASLNVITMGCPT